MKVALTGGTGFIGKYIIDECIQKSHQLRCWHRPTSDLSHLAQYQSNIEYVVGDLSDCGNANELVEGCDAVIHNAFWRPGKNFQGGEGDVVKFVETNVVGTLKLIEAAISAGVPKFVHISTCAVHEKILNDRKLDEAHPLWPLTHYGAHKAAIEKFVHSYGFGHGYDISCIRPTGVYGVHHDLEKSKWYDLVAKIVNGESVVCERGGKEVHAQDVARAAIHLLTQDDQKGEVFSCYDRYISQFEVASIAKEITQSNSDIAGAPTVPKNEIDNSKLKSLNFEFGGDKLLRNTLNRLVMEIQK